MSKMTSAEVRALVQHYNKSEQGNDPIACQTRIALCEFAALIEEHEHTRGMMLDAVELLALSRR